MRSQSFHGWIILLVIPLLVTACQAAPKPPVIMLPTLTRSRNGQEARTPVVYTATPLLPARFSNGLPSDVQITESTISLEYGIGPADLLSGLYTLFLSKESNDYIVWVKAPGEAAKRLATCRSCPISFFQLFSARLEADSPWIQISAVTPGGENEWVVIDPIHRTAQRYACRLNTLKPETCRPVIPPPGGNRIAFGSFSRLGLAPSRYFLLSGDLSWETITGSLFEAGKAEGILWNIDGAGFTVVGSSGPCTSQNPIWFVSLTARRWLDWSDFACAFHPSGAVFAGLSPDGSQAAFLWEKAASDGSQSHHLESISICPVNILGTTKISSCREIASGLSTRMWFFSPDAPGDSRGGQVSTFQWLDASQFLWVSYGAVGSNRTWVGTIDLQDHIRILLQEGLIDGLRLSPDRLWLIYRLHGEEWVYHELNLEDETDLTLDLPEGAYETNWLLIP